VIFNRISAILKSSHSSISANSVSLHRFLSCDIFSPPQYPSSINFQDIRATGARLRWPIFSDLEYTNLDFVAEVAPWFSGAYTIRMQDAAHTEIPMSRRYAASIKKLTGWR